jgi:dTDP-glucose 4,6-dehydratase
VHISTDEVYGSLGDTGKFTEQSNYAPNSPYSASKAASDHLVRAWHHTYGLPTITTHCTNNYGSRQNNEKLIPHMIECALSGRPLPIYGNGRNIRDWIHVMDHCRGIYAALTLGKPGDSYGFGGSPGDGAIEVSNLQIVESICTILDQTSPRKDRKSYREQMAFVEDRLGHDWRYAIDDSKARGELGYTAEANGILQELPDVVAWYVARRGEKGAS